MIFSEQSHVAEILNGEKEQTTRLNGRRKIKTGDILYPYFKSRMKKGTCFNCINRGCKDSNYFKQPFKNDLAICPDWINKFGTASVTKVEDFDPLLLSQTALETWAQADGFPNFEKANEWFTKVHGPDWIYKPWVIIYFKGDWLKDA